VRPAQAPGDQNVITRHRLQAWWWLPLYVALALILDQFVAHDRVLFASGDLSDDPEAWSLSSSLEARGDDGALRLLRRGPAPGTASRLLTIPQEGAFLGLRACFASAYRASSVLVAAVSIREGRLDFNRPYRLASDNAREAGTCLEARLPRRDADASQVLLQVQLRGADRSVVISDLTVTALEERRFWHALRLGMLAVGLAALTLVFSGFVQASPRWAAWAGLTVVAGIVFGCCVSSALKADIYVLLSGGRTAPAPGSAAELLRSVVPAGGFSIFTLLHAVLFSAATVLLLSVRRHAWCDLLLLGIATETLQVYVPGRGPGLSDALVDAFGVGVGMGLFVLLRCAQGKRLTLQK